MAEAFVNVTEGSGKKLHGWDRTIGANSVLDEGVFLGENNLAGYIFAATGVSTATANSHALQIMAGASLKVRIRRIEVVQTTAATTGAIMQVGLFRLTTAGTGGGAIVPQPLDTGDAASGATAMTLPTVKGTEGAVQLAAAAPYMIQTIGASTPFYNAPLWFWDFDRPRTKPLIIATGVANGIAVKIQTAIAGATISLTVWLDETSFI